MIHLSDNELLSLLLQFKSNPTLTAEILDELIIRKHLTLLDQSYIDEILDTYNEYKRMYEWTGDINYTDNMFAWECEFYKVSGG